LYFKAQQVAFADRSCQSNRIAALPQSDRGTRKKLHALEFCRMPITSSSLVLPNLVICGAPKAATSSLFEWIAAHPDAQGTRDKETYFFVDPGTHMYCVDCHVSNGLERYGALFAPMRPGNPAPLVRLEATPGYIYSKTALEQIPDLPTAPKCLFVLREPAAQIHSLFSYFQGNWDWIPADMSFADYLEAIAAGRTDFKGNELASDALHNAEYVDFLESWHARLGPDRMKVLLFEDLRADPKAVTQEVARWVGLAPEFYEDFDFKGENETYAPRSRLLHRVNLALRAHLPKGRLYEALRALYRKLNTGGRRTFDATTQQAVDTLRARYVEPNRRLAERFGLDLSVWEARPQDD
jgi:hypothetical protein